MKKMLMLVMLFTIGICFASQEIQYSSNSSKYGSWFQDINYGLKYDKIDLEASIRKEKIGDIYGFSCNYTFGSNDDIDYFAFVAASDDEIMDNQYFRVGVGGGKYFYKTKKQKHKFSIAAITYNGSYSTSIRIKSNVWFDKFKLKNVYNYIPESCDVDENFDADYMISEKFSIGYKYAATATNKTNNYRDSMYLKYKF